MPAIVAITHNHEISKALEASCLVSSCIVVDKLLLDADCYDKDKFGAHTDATPEFTITQDASMIISQLREAVKGQTPRIVFEPRWDAISWAQQIGSALGYTSKDSVYVAMPSCRDLDIGSLLSHPAGLPAHYPSEWFLLRMLEGVSTANINSCFLDLKLDKELFMQNLYSLYMLYKVGKLAVQNTQREYKLIVRDKLTGLVIGEQVPPPAGNENEEYANAADFQPYGVIYKNSPALAEKVLKSVNSAKFELVASKTDHTELNPLCYPTIGAVFTHLLSNTILPVGAIFNDLYRLYTEGKLLYPFGGHGKTSDEVCALVQPLLQKRKIPFSSNFTKRLFSCAPGLISCIPISGSGTFHNEDEVLHSYIDSFAIDAFRSNCKCAISNEYYQCGDAFFCIRQYDFPNLNDDAKSALYRIYPNCKDKNRFGVYVHTSKACDRVPFQVAMEFSMNSPCWIKWFIALHYLLEKQLLSMDGENICLTPKALDAIEHIETHYGRVFEDPRFAAFDAIFNNSDGYGNLITKILALFPKTGAQGIDLER